MEAESKYTYVGLALVLLVAALVTGVIWLNRTGTRADFNYYTVYFERQPLDGLQLGADVDMRGIKIGRVEDYQLLAENINRVRVTVRTDKRAPVRTNTVAIVTRNFVTGIAKVSLITPEPLGPPLTEIRDDQQHPVIPEGESNLDALAGKVNQLGDMAAETLENLNDVLKPRNRVAFTETLDNLRKLTAGLNARLAEVDKSMAAMNAADGGHQQRQQPDRESGRERGRRPRPDDPTGGENAAGHLRRHPVAREAGGRPLARLRRRGQRDRGADDRRRDRTEAHGGLDEPRARPTAGSARRVARRHAEAERTRRMMPATRRSALILGCSALLLAGCISVDVGNSEGNVRAQFRLDDLAPPPGPAGKKVARSLVVVSMPSLGVGDTFSMAYSRAPQQRALYQNASWADRPSNRVVQLLVRRIDARAAFTSVAELGSGVGGDLALNVTVDELLHDTAVRERAARADRGTRRSHDPHPGRAPPLRRRCARRPGERARRRRRPEPGADERARRTRAVARSVRGKAACGCPLTAAEARCATRARAAPRHATSSAAS